MKNNIIETDNFTWNFDVNVFKLLGSQLISDKFTAIIELVKNSYDANATEVKIDFIDTHDPIKGKIIIQDNGFGMSKNDIQNKWMKIGTNNKRTKKHTPKPFNRVLLGEKGIGRFAIEKISNHIILESKQPVESIFHNLEIDWREYEKAVSDDKPPLFTAIVNKYHAFKEINNSKISKRGTVLTFKSLKEVWTTSDIKRLKRELAKFVSPIVNNETNIENKFKIFVKEGIEKQSLFDVSEYEEVINDSLSYATVVHKVSFNKEKQEELHWNEEEHKLEVLESNKLSFGFVKIHIYYFNSLDKKKFKSRYKGKDLTIDGFKVYRDGILATPFVEIGNLDKHNNLDKHRDILGIDKRRWSNFFGKIDSHDFIGIIEITKENNPNIKDLTNRQDFEATSQYLDLKAFIIKQIEQIENQLDYEKRLIKKEDFKQIKNAENELGSIKNNLDSLIKRDPKLKDNIEPIYSHLKEVSSALKTSSKEIIDLQENIEKKEELFFSLMSLQEYASDLAHMVGNSLDDVLQISEVLVEDLEETDFYAKALMLDNSLNTLQEDANYMIDYAESGDKLKVFDLSQLILKVFEKAEISCEKENIFIQLNKPESFIVTHNETFLRDIFQNLISNSRRALRKVERDKKIIKCTANKEDNSFVILFSDNGIGIENDIKAKIFDRYFTTTKEEGGAGIGLFVVRNNLKTLNGTIELIESEFKDVGCTFKITIPIKRQDND
jgi:signal transduction histidine kinase